MQHLKINNFKCFSDTEIQINDLTVLAGANGGGKSSVVQAILLLRETTELYAGKETKIPINESYKLQLGASDSILKQDAEGNSILLSIGEEGVVNLEAEYHVDIDKLYITVKKFYKHGNTSVLQPNFYYLNAERLGPRHAQRMVQLPFNHVGYSGEYTAQLLASFIKINKERFFEGVINPYLINQTNAWLETILPGVIIKADDNKSLLQVQVKVENQYVNDFIAAPNIGFGISYALPIIVECLIAESGAMVIVENPEAHLHPSAQSAMGYFLASMSASGINIIIETHSEHIISGIQLFVARNKDFHSHVTINNFSIEKEVDYPVIEAIGLDEYANILSWPKGFLDQSQQDFVKLTEERKHNV